MSIFGKIRSAIFGGTAAAASAAPSATSTPASPTQPAGTLVDVAAVLDSAVAAQKEHLLWRQSIVDLLKALKLDSSLAARKELARELHYDGDTEDTTKMNVWLHKQVLAKLAENGGKLPDDLKI